MAKEIVQSIENKPIGFAPILKQFYDRCNIVNIIDELVPLDTRRKVLTHGEASIAMITAILCRVLQLYKIASFAQETTILETILPDISAEEYFDDRLSDTLDALYKSGLGNIELLITKYTIKTFGINYPVVHNDTTSASVWGNCSNNKTPNSIQIGYGYSKKHRDDLKQLVWSLSVSSDYAFPLFQQAYSGNTADVTTYVEQWHNLIDLLGTQDFVFVADSKLASFENMAHIHDNHGFFVTPAPMYESYKSVFEEALDTHSHETLLPYKEKFNRGFEIPFSYELNHKTYTYRMIVIFDHGLRHKKQKTINTRIEKTKTAFEELSAKLNKRKLKTQEAIDKACYDILKKNKTSSFFTFEILNNPFVVYKNEKPGRPTKNSKKIAVNVDHFSISWNILTTELDNALNRCGYYPIITNKPADHFTIEDVMLAHKGQYKNEYLNRRVKTELKLEPIYLHTPERIQALLFLYKIALQIIVLVERTARRNIQTRDKGLDNFLPNRNDVRNPRAETLLAAFQYITLNLVTLPGNTTVKIVSSLSPLQLDLLSILEVPQKYFTAEYLFDTS